MLGQIFHNRYEIVDLLGSGATSIVYKGRDILLNRMVTIKNLREQCAQDEAFVKRFRNEAKAVAKLSHPNIVNIYDVVEEGNNQYLVMEYVEGCSLKEYVETKGRLSEGEVFKITSQLLDALEHAHVNNIVHRDIKPHNILMDTNGNVKVTDFGLAVATTEMSVEDFMNTKEVMGSVYYMSPEQITGKPVSPATDIYAVGIVLYELLTGTRPFNGEDAISIARKHIKGEIVPPHKIDESISKDLSFVIMKSLRKDPDLRFASAEMMLKALRATQGYTRKIELLVADDGKAMPVIPTNFEVGDAVEEVAYEQGGTARTSTRTTKKKAKVKPSIILILVAVLAVGIIGYYAHSINTTLSATNSEVAVPDLLGVNIDEATLELEELGIQYTLTYSYSNDYGVDEVMFQNIPANQMVKVGRYMDLTVSKGSETFEMPLLIEMSLRDATVALSNNKVTVVTEEVIDSKISAGYVVSQDPVYGTEVNAGDTITLTVSKGKEVAMVDLVGITQDEATAKLLTLGLSIGTVTRVESYDYDEGFVIAQGTAVGTMILEGETVDLTVSSGPGPTSQIARLQYMMPATDREYGVTVYIYDDRGDRKVYDDRMIGGDTLVQDIEFWGKGTIKVFLDGEMVYSEVVE